MSASIYYMDERDDYTRAMDELRFTPAQKEKMVEDILKKSTPSCSKHQAEMNSVNKTKK